MPDRTFRDVDVDLDDLADAVVDWFEHDGFEVQDYYEGPAVFIQARKQNLVSTLSATTQALNVRLTPLASGFKVQVGAGEWFDKGVGAAITGLALKFINPLVALGTGVATGYGVYQQMKLPDLLLDFIEAYVERHTGVPAAPPPVTRRAPRQARADDVDDELAELKQARTAPATAADPAGTKSGRQFCSQCGAPVQASDNFCPGCGARVVPRAAPPAPDVEPQAEPVDEPADE